MKKIAITILFMTVAVAASAQHTLKKETSAIRAGDELIKQQVEYKDPGRDGKNVIWDFSEQKSINDEYTVVYSAPGLIGDSIYIMGVDTFKSMDVLEDELVICTEHHTMYYYRLTDSALYRIGHENPATLLKYTQVLPDMKYPLNYGDKSEADYSSEGIYSSSVRFATEGKISIEADAEGMMILPGGDSLKNVIRIKTVQTISESIPQANSSKLQTNTLLENYRWYSRGYRYPVFETVKTSEINDETVRMNFGTAFFYPPQAHYYLDDDAENLALQEESNEEENPWAALRYNFYPNPVTNFLNIEILLPRKAQVKLQFRSQSGILLLNENKGVLSEGLHRLQLNLPVLQTGNYILTILPDDYAISEIILKR